MINVEQAQLCIGHIGKSAFDTHDFIKQFMNDFERDYVELLYNYRNASNGIYRSAHASIGRFLMDQHKQLRILPISKEQSSNIKGNISENQLWERE